MKTRRQRALVPGLLWSLASSVAVTGCGELEQADAESADAGSTRTRDASSVRPDDDERRGDRDAPFGEDERTTTENVQEPPPVEIPMGELGLSATRGTTPLFVVVKAAPEGAQSVRYDWGEGAGFEARDSHRYLTPGSYTVVRETRDAAGSVRTARQVVAVERFVPVRWSRTDKSVCSNVSADGYEVECRDWGPGGVRSDAAIQPGSGVFYFEGHRLVRSTGGIGLATAAASLVESIGSTPQSMGVLGWGLHQSAGGSCKGGDVNREFTGFVVDYRGSTPVIHTINEGVGGAAEVRATCTMSVSAPLFIIYSGERSVVGYEMRINTGADTTNVPFHYGETQVRAALRASGQAATAEALVFGFGATRAPRVDAAPEVKLSGPARVAVGQPITITALATDAEDGDLSKEVAWSDLATQHHLQPNAKGAQFTFTATEPGRHPIRASVLDVDGLSTTAELMVEVTGTLPQEPVVRLVRDTLTGREITTSADMLSARFNANGKYGIRANQGIYGRFWYFEVRRNTPVRNMGMGLVVKDGSLDPYDFANVPWSMSINVSRGIWVNLIGAGDWTHDDADVDYGFAVDYRGEHPIVHILVHNRLQASVTLPDVWVPLYPMLYGNPEAPPGLMDMTINFGASAFRINAPAVLRAAGVDVSGLKVGWGDVNAR